MSPEEIDQRFLEAKEAVLEQAWRRRQHALEAEFRRRDERQQARELELAAWECRLRERERNLSRAELA